MQQSCGIVSSSVNNYLCGKKFKLVSVNSKNRFYQKGKIFFDMRKADLKERGSQLPRTYLFEIIIFTFIAKNICFYQKNIATKNIYIPLRTLLILNIAKTSR